MNKNNQFSPGVSVQDKNCESNYIAEPYRDAAFEGQELFQKFGFGPKEQPKHRYLHHAFESMVAMQPDAIAIEHEGESVTYAELNRRSNRLAALLQYYGVKPGECVGLFLRRSIEMVAGIFAILKIGACYAPQDVKISPKKQLQSVTEQADINVILTVSEYVGTIPGKNGLGIYCIDRLLSEVEKETIQYRPPAQSSNDDLCFTLFTSGTTGVPNGVRVTHKNVANIVLTRPGNLKIGPGVRVSQILNIAFDMAAWEILGCLCNGGTLLIRGDNTEDITRRADVIIATPSVLGRLDINLHKTVSTVAVAGETCSQLLADKWAGVCRFYNCCGPTETTIVNTMKQHCLKEGRVTIGSPIPNTSVYILDANLSPLPIGEIGEMWAGGDCVSTGYANNDGLTAERYKPDPFLGGGRLMFRTRDLGRWTSDGELEHHGRVDDQVKVRGFRIELDSIRTVLESLDGCERAVALKYDDDHLIAFVSPANVDVEAAYAIIESKLPYYCKPLKIAALDEFPMTSRGKVDTAALMEVVNYNDKNGTEPMTTTEGPLISSPAIKDDKKASLYRRVTANPKFSQYYRLAVFIGVINLILFGHGLYEGYLFSGSIASLALLSNIAVANFALGILVRSQYVINFLFWLATRPSTRWPLSMRWACGKVFHHGGVHIGGTISGSFWFLLFAGALTIHSIAELPGGSETLLVLCGVLVFVLMLILVTALPGNRMKRHDLFERMHRFGGWLALGLFWAVTIVFTDNIRGDQALWFALAVSPGFWMLSLITISIVAPWLYLKRVKIDVEKPSTHAAIVSFDYGDSAFPGSSNALSRNPLMEWHSFATIPTPGQDGFRMIISRAGDWTGRFIDDTPSHVWIKGITTSGVARIEVLFKRVVYVATGSGIGPVMPHLLAQDVPIHLIWATRNPRKTYGDDLIEEILSVCPDALIWDTDAHGKPDLVDLAHKAVESFDAEAVICISNQGLTRLVVEQMEVHGVPAFGAIWDS